VPSTIQSGQTSRDRESFPALRDDLGEDPAKFLDRPLVEYGEDHTDHTGRRMFEDRVSGIDSLAVIRAWKAVERRLDRGPREAVVQVLEQRESFLEREGEREERIAGKVPYRPRVAPRTAADYQAMVDESGQFVDTAALERLRDKRAESVVEDDDQEESATSTSTNEALVADGGESA
jgi:hypothetical protein